MVLSADFPFLQVTHSNPPQCKHSGKSPFGIITGLTAAVQDPVESQTQHTVEINRGGRACWKWTGLRLKVVSMCLTLKCFYDIKWTRVSSSVERRGEMNRKVFPHNEVASLAVPLSRHHFPKRSTHMKKWLQKNNHSSIIYHHQVPHCYFRELFRDT